MPLQATSGAASYDAFGGGVPVEPNYIESVFSTWLYTGNGSTQTITNGIDLAGKGGLVWIKSRNVAESNALYDTVRGVNQQLQSNNTDASSNSSNTLTAFNSNGFTLGTNRTDPSVNYASWTFRKQPKFFDVVTYTGTGSNTTIAHNLGSAPGCMIVKCTSNAVGWNVYHRSLTSAAYQLELNTTSAEFSDPTIWNSTAPTSTEFSVGTNLGINGSGRTYVAYLFAHNAGGFGLTGTDNVISCGTYTADGSGNATVNLGYEPQFVLDKITTVGDWRMFDNMRGIATGGVDARLLANDAQAEYNAYDFINLTSTGFTTRLSQPGDTYIYIAIRRGPMKVPTDGTKVFAPVAYSGTNTAGQVISGVGFSPDLTIPKYRAGGGGGAVAQFIDRLRGGTAYLAPSSTAAEGNTGGYYVRSFDMDGTTFGTAYVDYTYSGNTYVDWFFKRAPGFFDEVCYTGTGAATTVTHNLTAVPELMIVKNRGVGTNWAVYSSALGATQTLFLNTTATPSTITSIWNDTAPTSSVFTVGSAAATNTSTNTYVAYLFASCPGVSKVGSYTGTGTTQTINCGFTAGSRFVLIKRADSAGDWYVWDSARGIVAGNDPYLLLNDTAAEVTSTDYVDTYSAGFEISSTAPAAINASGGTFIFLAIA